uniref:Uncharacterized protein n=1 Tax=Arundo donax TaxID=35708 RepID=A0A0A9FP70_ARUDO
MDTTNKFQSHCVNFLIVLSDLMLHCFFTWLFACTVNFALVS